MRGSEQLRASVSPHHPEQALPFSLGLEPPASSPPCEDMGIPSPSFSLPSGDQHSMWDPAWGAHRPPQPPSAPGRAGASGSPLPLPSHPGASNQTSPRTLSRSKHCPGPRCEGQPARGEFKASSEGFVLEKGFPSGRLHKHPRQEGISPRSQKRRGLGWRSNAFPVCFQMWLG